VAGGIIIEVVDSVTDGKVWINCRDHRFGDVNGIWVERTAEAQQIEFGDTVWWQGQYAYWTPANRSRFDVRIPRIGADVTQPVRGQKEPTE
jgi:hypothetical protein